MNVKRLYCGRTSAVVHGGLSCDTLAFTHIGLAPEQAFMNDDTLERDQAFRQLRHTLRALAMAGAEQPTLFADLATSAQALASHYDQSAAVVRAEFEGDLSSAQLDALAAIDRKLATISRDGNEFDADLWTDAALRTGEPWSDVRRLAAAALDAFGWPAASTPDAAEDRESGVET